MEAGRMDRKITIQSRAVTQSATNDVVEVWTTFAERWASKRDISGSIGRERLQAAEMQGMAHTEFGIYYTSGLKNEMRIVCDGITYDIINIREVGRRAGMFVEAKAKIQ